MHIRLHGCYYVLDKDLKIDSGSYGHDVFVVKISKDKIRVKVKTITSIERNNTENGIRVFKKNKSHINYVEAIYDGTIVVIPHKDLNTSRLSGVHTKGIWVEKGKLRKSKFSIKFPKRYERIIGK